MDEEIESDLGESLICMFNQSKLGKSWTITFPSKVVHGENMAQSNCSQIHSLLIGVGLGWGWLWLIWIVLLGSFHVLKQFTPSWHQNLQNHPSLSLFLSILLNHEQCSTVSSLNVRRNLYILWRQNFITFFWHEDNPPWWSSMNCGFLCWCQTVCVAKTYLILGFSSVNLFRIMIYRIILRDLINQFFSHILKNSETSLIWVITICHSISVEGVHINDDDDNEDNDDEEEEEEEEEEEVEQVNHFNCWEFSTWSRRCHKLKPAKYILVWYVWNTLAIALRHTNLFWYIWIIFSHKLHWNLPNIFWCGIFGLF